MEFEWDENKRRSNIRDHGVDFPFATRIFRGPVLIELDDREDYGEDRMFALGEVDGTVYSVVYAERGDNIRIISAWKAEKHDRERYYQEVYPR